MLDFINDIKEKCKFGLLFQIVGGDNPEIFTDNENYFMARTNADLPLWIWNKNKLSDKKLNELMMGIEKFLIPNQTIKCTCSKELYETMMNNKFKYLNNDYFEMGTYYCKETMVPPKAEGKYRLVNKEDIPTLAKFHKDDRLEIGGVKITLEEAEKDIYDAFNAENKTFYVWEDNNHKIVCMALINRNNPFARINYVYTPKEERCKSYAKNLIYSLTNIVLKEGLYPILYTDFNYPASNKAYMAVGYESCGLLINFSCRKDHKE